MSDDVTLCRVCGLPVEVGQWACIKTIRPHGKSPQTHAFAAYWDEGLGEYVTSMGQRKTIMRQNQLDYREKWTKGQLSERRDRMEEQKRERSR